ncbi:MAG: DUF2959 family protein [Opitutus sp.]|nr:DUF2959 family protein [Opitutus sp.]MCS6246326.1 DUF2959 family protein [Opitutus sp.]MCS6273173.1 DUF2959 family protein [Opitutus sp.]MCS6278344.1 DUF2959 family protein [Opitutus sp.]MCS6299454.1 DUF2959 family protein [Opitutus sp.]
MKTPITPITAPLAAGLLVFSLLGSLPFSGCRSTPAKSNQAEINKAASMTQLRDDLRATRASLNRTTEALNRIQAAPNALGEYNNYSKELNVLQKHSANSLINANNVRETGATFFSYWEQETQSIQVAEVREIADQRRTSVQSSFNALSTPLAAARTRLTEVTTMLTDLRKALSLDLTAAGISSLRKQTEKATAQSAELATSLDSLATEVDKIANALPRPAPAAAK